tara:strand:- start:15751 stop:16992 length:1242 start_codon:yes stop_codon:yes gene_type:complete
MIKRNTTFNLSIKQILKNVHPDLSIKTISVEILNDILMRLSENIIEVATKMSELGKTKTITVREIMTSVRLLVPGELGNNAIIRWKRYKNIEKYRKAIINKKNNKKTPKEKYAGIEFNVSTCKTIIQNNIKKDNLIGNDAPVYLATVLEYLVAEILDLSGNSTRDNNRIKITPNDIMIAIKNDEELNILFDGSILGSGVESNINIKLLPKEGGSVQVNRITKPALQRLMYKAGVKYISQLMYEESKFILIDFLETILEKAFAIAEHKGNKTLMYEDGIETLKILKIKIYNAKGYPGKISPCKGSEKVSDVIQKTSNKRAKSSTNLIKIIREYQKTKCTLIPHAPMDSVIKEIGNNFRYGMKYESDFIWLIHAICEEYMMSLYQDALLVALHADRITIMPKDLVLIQKIRKKIL